MIPAWFKSKDIDEFADVLVADVRQRFPPTGIELSAKKGADRLRKIHQALFARVIAFARGNKLNLYRKARLGNRVKWALLDAGYPSQFVDAFVHELLTTIVVESRSGDVKETK
ncbi:MAG: hypothetical protein A2Z64_00645 [Betaproteobacteria bacterium RIFCSPLOWO2_02_67_12]|nr:MAG: hypothetical protein A2Z64_00645 [Betaproteobacteria bacterium RIFCSPLOWO2_02_67_12]OGA27438.1 MAG: hypothetical protein A3I65_06315 [Betaproteobacteria bacterium RIFCSPLOWO2_02_FULL_68_150]OGA72405.1 MAG: hypothetical protein A3F77_15930 [Betaproteobacteria bacterium RIFCSPLOWO2_12_FULL_67_28]